MATMMMRMTMMRTTMNRAPKMSLATSLLLGACMAFAQSAPQPLGDYARTVRKSKGGSSASGQASAAANQKTIYDNDTIPRTSSLSVVGNSGGSSSQPVQNASAEHRARSALESSPL